MSLTKKTLRVFPASVVLTVMTASPAAAKDVTVDSGGLQQWFKENAIPIAVFVIFLVIVVAARKKDTAGAFTVVFILLMGLMVLGLSVGSTASDVGAYLLGLVVTK
ncbi:hypothetical protein ACFY1V_31755 [Streptomyces sp. NPDC001255]|uniref:hypothetical protein n=1 Tax=Streptomyces sp. NPDC001255 TaxID=3364550 RepID=UPI0036B75E64